ncbi:MAG: SdrD B-like domain-containing protein [Coriobacteriia bacterium]
MTALTGSRRASYRRLLSAYVALVLVTAIAAPGVAISAEGSSAGGAESLEVSSTVQVGAPDGTQEPEGDPGTPPLEGDGGTTPTQDTSVAPIPEVKPDSGAKKPPAVLSSLGTLSTVGPIIAAVVPGTSTNLSFTFEGVRKSSGWITGNLQSYDEGEWVPYRVVIENKDTENSVSVPATTIQLDHFTGTGIMYDRTRSWGTYTTSTEPVLGDTWYPVTTAAIPTSQDVPVNPATLGTAELIKTSFAEGYLVIPPGEYGVLYFQAHLAVTAYWNMQTPSRNGAGFVAGSSGHGSLDMDGIGAKTVPVPSVPTPARYLSGVKFNDLDRDGVRDPGEPTLAGWSITLQGGESGFEIGTITDVTDANGAFSFGPLPSAIYSLNEVQQTDWTNSTALPMSVSLESANQVRDIGNYHDDVVKTFELTYAGIPAGAQPYVRYAINGGPAATAALTGSPLRAQVNVPYGSSLTTIEWRATYGDEDLLLGVSPTPEVLTSDVTNTFTYTASLAGSKFNDLNADGVWDQGEGGLSGWTIQLQRGGTPYDETVTGAGGAYSFSGLLPGSYTLSEVQQGGWVATAAPQGATAVANGTAATGLDFGNVEVLPEISVVKTALPTQVPETGGSVVFSFTITNDTSAFPVTVTSIIDDKFGDLLAIAEGQNGGLDIVLDPDASFTFTITRTLSSDLLIPHINTVTVIAVDEFDRSDTDDDDATVTFSDVPPAIRVIKTAQPTTVPETGGDVLFTITVENIGTEAVDLTEAVDSVFGAIPVGSFDVTHLDVGDIATYSFTEFMAGEPDDPHNNVATVTAEDNDGTPVSDDDDADVAYLDVLPSIEVVKDVDPVYLDEPGGTFSYQVRVKNTSAESIMLTLVEDDVYGVIYEWTEGDPEIWLLPNAVRIFDFTMDHTEAGQYDNTAEATAVDNDGSPASDDDDATALVGDVGPVVEIDKTVDVASLPEPGGDFTFTLTITNAGIEPFVITSLTDTNLTEPYPATVAALIGQTIDPGGELTASYTLTHTEAGIYDNVAVVEVVDNEESTDTDSDDESVAVTDVLPTLEVVKDVDPASMAEPGGTFAYEISVKNTSAESIMLTLVEDDVHGVIYEWTEGDPEIWLLPNAVRIFDFTADHTDAGQYVNVAEATVVDNEDNSASASDDAIATVTDALPIVEIDKTVDVSVLPEPGGDFTFTLTITNAGIEPFVITSLTDTNLTEPYPAAVAALIGQTIDPGGELTASYTLTHTEAGVYDNVAVVEVMDNEESTDTDSDDESVEVEPFLPFTEPDLAITKSVDKATAQPGQLLTYTLTYWNIGEADAYDFTITDDFDQRYVTVVNAAGGVVSDGKIVWTLEGPLSEADGKQTITYTVRVISTMPVGTTNVDNVVVIVHPDDGDLSNNTDTARTVVREEEPFLPFTGGEYLLLIGLAAVAATAGAVLRLRNRIAA